jgi:hypothetical protein
MNSRACAAVLIIFALLCSSSFGNAKEAQKRQATEDHKWALALYGGRYADRTLEDIITFDADYSTDANLVVAALFREIYRYEHYLGFELEGQIGRHFGDDLSHWEFVGLGLARWHPFSWDRILDTSFGFGAGLSYYTEISRLEKEREEDAQHLLVYLAYELTFKHQSLPRRDLLVRLHHRSGAAGVVGDGSSNYVCTGLRYAF